LGKETTFREDILDVDELLKHIDVLAEKVFERLKDQNLQPKTITLKVKYANFKQVTRASTQVEVIHNLKAIKPVLRELLSQTEAGKQAVRLLGVIASGFFAKENEGKDELHAQLHLKLK